MSNSLFRPISALVAAAITTTACVQQAIRQEEEDNTPAQVLPTPDWKTAVKELKLSNGMTILLRENHAAPAVTWMVFYRVGSINEGPGMTGAAHLLEHMLFKGTQRFRKGQISQVLGRNGARFNATTNEDYTNYFETYSSDRLELGLMIESDRMRNSLILDSERQAEMTVVRNELERGENNPEFNLYDAVRGAAFHSHPYHHPVIGFRSDVEGISTPRLKQIYDMYYQPSNAVGVLVGDFKTPQAIALVKQYFEGIQNTQAKPVYNYTKEEPQIGERRVTLKKWGDTNVVAIGYHTPEAASKDSPALALIESILSRGVNSRLQRLLVDGGQAVRASAWAEVMKDPGLFWLTAVLRPGVSHKAVEDALLAEIEKLKATPVSQSELRIAKNQYEAYYAFNADGTSGAAWQLGQWAMVDRWQRFFEILDELRAVTPADLQSVAKKFFGEDNRTVGHYIASKDFPRTAREDSDKAKATPTQKQFIERFPTQPWEARPAPVPPVTGLRTATLDNGLRISVLRNNANPTIAVQGFVRAGYVLDKAESGGRYGTAALTSAMLDKGTAKRNKAKLARDLESVGADLSWFSDSEMITFKGQAVSKDTDRLIEALVEELATPAFPDDELALLRGRTEALIQQDEEQPERRAYRVMMQKLYPEGHPFHLPDPAEAIADMKAVTPGTLRAFHQRFYGPNTTAVSIVGDVDPDAIITKLKALTESWKPVSEIDFDRQIPGWNVPMTRADKPFVETMLDKSNVVIRVGQVANLRRLDRDYYSARVMNYILGGSTLTGRLGLKLRDELGLTYGTGSSLNAGRVPGPWVASVTVNRKNVPTAYNALLDVVRSFLKDGPTEDEVADAKSSLIGQQAVGLSSNGGMAASLMEIQYYGFDPAKHWSDVARNYTNVSSEKTRAAAIKLINPDDAITVIAGPYDDRSGGLGANSPERTELLIDR
jgi:zinc protease